MSVRTIELSADVGEDPRALADGREERLLASLSAVHIACAGHAGDDDSMRRLCTIAHERGLAIGAHPSYPDREGFGRVSLVMDGALLRASLVEQIRRLREHARAIGAHVSRVKPHGALYHDVARDPDRAAALLGALRACDPALAIVVPPRAATLGMWKDSGCAVLLEGFADRAYTTEGTLIARDRPGAVLTDPDRAGAQALTLAEDGLLGARIDTLCLHADTPGAPAIARAVRRALEGAGHRVSPLH